MSEHHQVVIGELGYLTCPRQDDNRHDGKSILLVKSHRGSWSKYECMVCGDWYVTMRPIDQLDEDDKPRSSEGMRRAIPSLAALYDSIPEDTDEDQPE
jgi:hypothetical protein